MPSRFLALAAVVLLACPSLLPAADVATGKLVIASKSYKIVSAVAYESKVFDDNAVSVLFCSKTIPVDKLKKALKEGDGSDGKFIFFEPSIKITFNKEGKTSFCNAYADGNSVSVSGSDLSGEIVVKDGRATGTVKLAASGEGDRQTSFEGTFDLPLLTGLVPKIEPKTKPMKPAAEEPDDKPAPRPAGPAIAVQTVVPKDATDLTLKTLVQHLNFKHPSSVPVLASSLSKHLAERGWTKKGADLVTPKSAILNRSQGAAELTIFIKPDGTGATVSMMTKGLSWEAAK